VLTFKCISVYPPRVSADPGLVHHHRGGVRGPRRYLLQKLPLQGELPAAHLLEALRGEGEGVLRQLRDGLRREAGREEPKELLREQGARAVLLPQPQGVGGDLGPLHLLQERAVLQHPAAVRGERPGLPTGEETRHGPGPWNRDALTEARIQEQLLLPKCNGTSFSQHME